MPRNDLSRFSEETVTLAQKFCDALKTYTTSLHAAKSLGFKNLDDPNLNWGEVREAIKILQNNEKEEKEGKEASARIDSIIAEDAQARANSVEAIMAGAEKIPDEEDRDAYLRAHNLIN